MHISLNLILLAIPALFCAVAMMPRPEHPRPDRKRKDWLNLNGAWEFAETDDDEDLTWLEDKPYPDTITVPFCRESELSGLNRKGFVRNVWYRRTIQRPADWQTERTILHLGACDWLTTVYINGKLIATHQGGSAPIDIEITNELTGEADTLIVHAYDDVRTGKQAGGKQSTRPESHGCSYTRTTGIWQTVWLEGVGSAYIDKLRIDADINRGQFTIKPTVKFGKRSYKLKATVYAEGKEDATDSVTCDWRNNSLQLNLKTKRLWCPSDPFLYTVKLQLLDGSKVVDEIETYAGLRAVTIDGAAILINNEPIFQRLILDQGFYPDGIWTAPNEQALVKDIELSMALGYNGARLHEKVFEPLFLYHADRMGYLVWGEFPNWCLNSKDRDIDMPVINEWGELMERDINHPAIIGWCPFNETGAEMNPLQSVILEMTRRIDPARPVIDTSGYVHCSPDLDVNDDHDYEGDPVKLGEKWDSLTTTIPFFLSEYGGIAWSMKEGGWGYGDAPKTLEEFYARYKGVTDVLLNNRLMFGLCYTQLTDVEQEQNGLYTYYREPKFDTDRMKAIMSRRAAYEIDPPVLK
jgi:beta-galactosidase/beta-glucuronidase